MEKLKIVSPFRLSSLLRLQEDPKLALQLFLNPKPNPNSSTKPFRYTRLCYDLVITKLGRAKMFDELDQILSKLKLERRFTATEIIFCNVITYYARARLPEKALEIYDQIPSFGCHRTVKSLNSLLNGLLICGEFDKMQRIFVSIDRFACPDACTFNIMINASRVRGDMDGARNLFDEMRQRGFRPNPVTFATLISGLCENSMLKEAFRLKKDMLRVYRVKPNGSVYASLIKGLCRVNELTLAFKLKDEMLENKILLDSAIYTTLISGLFKAGRKAEVLGVLEEMRRNGCEHDTATYNALIAGFCGEEDFDWALRMVNKMGGKACKPDVITYNTLIGGYCKAGRLQEAMDIFEDMPRRGCSPDVVSYRILLDGLLGGFASKEAAVILDEMIFKGYHPHSASITKFIDGLREEANKELLSIVVNSLAKGNLIDPSSWKMAISTVYENDKLLNSFEVVDNLIK
ncbi:hypothetical protein Nepgr_026105 [Nepenthes gracilis]|uniref:Pentatricopeptide repeat-containing protein n=1 Tax=Nepenthes gracilis TaxID=150966 RepID=A0AAD3T7M5_NEPGR|nr:hypothetical protein Nepgr_026105 [Nepenthes gracilis]